MDRLLISYLNRSFTFTPEEFPMRCRIGVLLASLLVASPLLAVDKTADKAADKTTDKKSDDRATQFKEIQKDYLKAVPEAQKALQAAKSPKDRMAVFAKLNKEFAPRVIKLVEADPKDKSSFEMLTWAMQALPDVDSKVYDLLGEHWAKDAKIKTLCMRLSFQPQTGAKKMLEKVLENNSDKDVQGLACFALAKIAGDEMDKGDKKAEARAEKLYERINKEFAAVKIGRGTLGNMAKGALFEIQHLGVGKTAPNVASEDLEGKKVALKDYKGKVVVIDIWATWCGPCRAMIPHEREMVEKFKDKPFALISVSADAKVDTLKDFLKEEKMPWTHWWNGQTGGIVEEWNIQHFPTIYVIDAKGVIRYKEIRGKELEEAVDKLIAEAKK